MKLSTIQATERPVWVPLAREGKETDFDLEVQIVPGRVPAGADEGGPLWERRMCEECFLDFRNLDDESDQPIENALEVRLTLIRNSLVRQAILARCIEYTGRIIMEANDQPGEGLAVCG